MISIIVPIYNKQEYLEVCITSILKQSYTDYELLLIDDGSTDNSASICDSYANKDPRVKVYHLKQSGVSNARNFGISKASGEYICFVDGDDILTGDAINNLYRGIVSSNADLAIGEIAYVYPHTTIRNRLENKVYSLDNKDNAAEFLVNILESSCGKLFKKKIIEDNNIEFPISMKTGEDALFLCEYLANINTISVISDVVYLYNKLDINTATGKFYQEINDWYLKILQEESKAYNVWGNDKKQIDECVYKKLIERLTDCLRVYSICEKDNDKSIKYIEDTYKKFNDYAYSNGINTSEKLIDDDRLDKRLVELLVNKDYQNIRNYYIDLNNKSKMKYIYPISKILVWIRRKTVFKA